MNSKILGYADEILSMEGMRLPTVRRFLKEEYGLTPDEIDEVIVILDGEGYFDV